MKTTLSLITLILISTLHNAYAVPISYQGELQTDVTYFGQISEPSLTGSPADDFWWFSGNAGDTITLTVNRLENALDPAFDLYFGTGADTSTLLNLVGRDDNYAQLPGFSGPFADPQLLNYVLPTTGNYTAQVWSFASDSAGNDGLYDYQITLGTPPTSEVLPHNTGSVPEPTTIALLGLGFAGLGFRRFKSTSLKPA